MKTILILLIFANFSLSQQPRYRFILPPAPPQPPALNNTIKPQIANQNINFNTSSNTNGFGGFNSNYGGIQGTIQYTQNNTPGYQISNLYQLPLATHFQQNNQFSVFNQFGNNNTNNGFSQFSNNINNGMFNQNNTGLPIGINNPFYQMAMQGITAGISGSAFQSGGGFGQFLNNNQFNNNNMFNQFNGGFNNGGNGL